MSTPAVGRAWLPASLLLALAATLLGGCEKPEPDLFQGYIEGDYLHLSAPVPGTLLRCEVERGSEVTLGKPLFVLESVAEQAAVEEARQRVAQAAARVANLRQGRRPSEIAALEARRQQAQANLTWWESEAARREQLRGDSVIAPAELEQTRSQRDAARATLAAATAELETARLGGRDDEIHAAEADEQAATAVLARARWVVEQKSQAAPAAGLVHDTLFRVGEFVPAGQPVVSLLPPASIKVRFFVPEPRLPKLTPGTVVQVSLDGVAAAIPATVSYRSTRPEFTPPVIYSRQSRTRLVYLVEATLNAEAATHLHPGQPVDVRLPTANP